MLGIGRRRVAVAGALVAGALSVAAPVFGADPSPASTGGGARGEISFMISGDPAELAAGADVVLTTYATATRDADDLAAVQWDRVVLDEAQHIKNAASGVATARGDRLHPLLTSGLGGRTVRRCGSCLWPGWFTPAQIESSALTGR